MPDGGSDAGEAGRPQDWNAGADAAKFHDGRQREGREAVTIPADYFGAKKFLASCVDVFKLGVWVDVDGGLGWMLMSDVLAKVLVVLGGR